MHVSTGTDENSMAVSQIIKKKLPRDSTISILAQHPKESKSIFQIDTCTHRLMAAVFTIDKELLLL